MNEEKTRNEARQLRKEFNARSPKWRIESVIHDGSWYDIPKWAKVAKVDEDDIREWIKNNGNNLIKSRLNSYRTKYEDIINWYEKEGIDIEQSIVPSNFPPKVWTGKTETEIFIEAPRRRVGTVNFEVETEDILEKVSTILRGVGRVSPEGGSRYRAYGLSAIHMRNLLSKGLTFEEFKSLDLRIRSILLQRELVDLPDEWLKEALPFYSKIFAPGILRPSMSTIEIYLPDRADRQSQIMIWIILAIKKFNEEASVPFSGYLSNVLRYWPYDLPDEFLGKELAKFQREKKKAIESILPENGEKGKIPVEELAELMEISLEEFLSLNEEHENWLAELNATTLTWEDSANEKKGELLGTSEQLKPNIELMSRISMAVVKSAVDTKEWNSAYLIIKHLDTPEIDEELKTKLSSEFISKFAEHLNNKNDEN